MKGDVLGGTRLVSAVNKCFVSLTRCVYLFVGLLQYRKKMKGFAETPLGRGVITIFFLWFVLSGWMFRTFVLATWVLPFAAPLLIGAFANNFVIEGNCPACRKQFVGYRNQIIRCTGCGNIVWQPGKNYGRETSRRSSELDIIDIEIEEK